MLGFWTDRDDFTVLPPITVLAMEPTGIEPVTSCLQNASGNGRLRVESGYLRMDSDSRRCWAGLHGSFAGS
jgi:hypothetical protein